MSKEKIERRLISKYEDIDLDCIDIDSVIEQFIKIRNQYGPDCHIYTEVDGYEDESYCRIYVRYEQLESITEAKDRIKRDENVKKRNEEYERKTFKRLKKKFDN